MKYLKVLLVVSCTSLFFATDVALQSEGNMLKMSPDCMEGLRVCSDFMTNQYCLSRSIWKRADASGPFWANRGKRDPNLTNNRLYAEMPYWKLVHREEDGAFDPFFTTRGKKQKDTARDRRTNEKLFLEGVSPFLAARGKKSNIDLSL